MDTMRACVIQDDSFHEFTALGRVQGRAGSLILWPCPSLRLFSEQGGHGWQRETSRSKNASNRCPSATGRRTAGLSRERACGLASILNVQNAADGSASRWRNVPIWVARYMLSGRTVARQKRAEVGVFGAQNRRTGVGRYRRPVNTLFGVFHPRAGLDRDATHSDAGPGFLEVNDG
jgi:hypothetical protein